jgi:transcriptional regulator with XRE-family HTH domain
MPKIFEVEHKNKFASILKAERLRRNMSLEEMAEFLGTTKQVLSRYERGERNPKLITAALFAKKLDIPISYFENNADIEETANDQPGGNRDAERQEQIINALQKYEEIISLFDALPDNRKQEAKNYLRFLAMPEEKK